MQRINLYSSFTYGVFKILQDHQLRRDGNNLGNINGGDLKLFGEAKLAEGQEIVLAEHILLVLGSHHHRRVFVGGSAALRALQTRLVEDQVRDFYRVLRKGLNHIYDT